jgi:hypothetical protein
MSRELGNSLLVRLGGTIGLATALFRLDAFAQDAPAPKEVTKGGYVLHQTVDLGGHIASISGSGQMYSTLVNIQSGPRILNHYFTMRAVDKNHFPLFDSLTTTSTGHGGDPNAISTLRMSKGKLYDFQGMFRRDRQYFDYDLFNNPLIPAGVTSNGYTFPQVLSSPHLFNTVRRMTDVNLTLLPISKVSIRFGYSQNINQGPSYSSIHMGTEALLYQNWRNSTDTWLAAVDWKPRPRTSFTYEEHITHYKGDTNWQLAGANLQLSNGVPVTLGFDNVTAPAATTGTSPCGAHPAILNSGTVPPTANPCENGYLQYSRSQPTRTLFPTEEFRFQSSDIKSIKLNGRILYTGANLNLPNFREYFSGLESRTTLRAATTTGYARAQRINVTADLGLVWQATDKFSLSEQYSFDDFRQPGVSYLSEVDQAGTSMLNAPGAAQAADITAGNTFLGQKTHSNTVTGAYEISPRANVSLSYRYRSRLIDRSMPLVTDALSNGTAYTLNIHENGGILGVSLHPVSQLRVNGSLEVSYADKSYTQISPRALQHYQIRTTYKLRPWATLSGTFNDLERRNNVLYVNHLDHSRSATISTSLMPNEHYGMELSYGYVDIFTRTGLCYTATPAPAGAIAVPSGTSCGSNTLWGSGYYDAPTQYGAIGFVYAPGKRLHSAFGYRVNAVNGNTETLNARQVAGTLQSQFHTPYANVAWLLMPGWSWKADWNYYAYGEATAVGPTLPRSFHSNIFTIGVHHEF